MKFSHSTHSINDYTRLLLPVALAGSLLLAGCNRSGSSSVITDAAPAPTSAAPEAGNPAAPVATPAAEQTPAAGATPAALPDQAPSLNSVSVIKTAATSATPAREDGPPPAPTPEVRRVNGRVVQHWQAPAEFARMTSPVAGKPDAVKFGKYYYDQRCADCHGRDGLGNGRMAKLKGRQATNLASEVVQANTDGELFYKVTNTDKDRLPHPKSEARFSDEQRWYIVSYIRSLGSSGGK